MTLDALIRLVDEHYPDHCILTHWDSERCIPRERVKGGSNDTLALFLVRELKDVFDPKASDREQLTAAIHAVKLAEKELGCVVEGLEAALRRVRARGRVIPFPKKEPEEP